MSPRLIVAFCATCLLLLSFCRSRAADPPATDPNGAVPATSPAGEIRLVVRADDMGVSQSVNEACVLAYKQGIVRSVEVIVPGPWFPDAVRLLKEHPGLDVGVHLCLTSEWERVKWRPLTHAPSLTDADGYFYPMTAQRADFPPNTGFLNAGPRIDEVERELRAQIETALRHLPGRVSHVTAHMGAATSIPPFRVLTSKLAAEYKLDLDGAKVKRTGGMGSSKTPQEREAALVALLEKLTPEVPWMVLEHPGLDTPEMRAMGHKGYENVAEDRAAVTRAFTSEKVKQVVRDRNIRLISYADLKPPEPKAAPAPPP